MASRYVPILLLMVLSSSPLFGQTPAPKSEAGAYLVPFATKGNRIELTVANETERAYEEVEARVVQSPAWIMIEALGGRAPSEVIPAHAGIQGESDRFLDPRSRLRRDRFHGDDGSEIISAGDADLFSFTFSVDDSAPTEEVHPLTFEVYSHDDLLVTKQIDISIELPKKLILRGNYPNPFNPSTTIGFVQPEDGDLTLEIFDALGRSVDRLYKTGSKRGQQTLRWNATSHASGVYFYRLQLRTDDGVKEPRLGKMMLIK